MIRLFGATDTTFTSNGDVVLKPIKAKVHKKDNSDYYLELETSLDYVDYIIEGNIVVANTPTGDQAFRISNVQKTKSKISSKCYHVFYDSKNYLIANASIIDKTCKEALGVLNSATEPQSEFATLSDILTINTYNCARVPLYSAIMDVVSLWGGHLVRDNFSIQVKQSIGQDNGIIVQYKKNLKDITVSENWDNVVTKLLPTGKDGVMLNAVNPSADIYVTSSTQYDIPYTKTVSFSQDINEDDYPTEQDYLQALVDDLLIQATNYVANNNLPKVNYTLKANLDRVSDIGDTIEVIDERLGVHLLTSVIGFTYDCISEQYAEVVFGNFSETINGLIGKINSNTEKVAEQTTQEQIDKTFPDFIEAYGTTDGWNWKQYKSKTVEAWKTVSIDSFTWSSFGTYYKGEVDITYPFNISDAVITATVNDCTSVGWVAKAKAVDNTKMHLQVVSNTNNDTMTVHIHVKA